MKQGSFKIGLIKFRYFISDDGVAYVYTRALNKRQKRIVKLGETFYGINSLKELKEAVVTRFGLS